MTAPEAQSADHQGFAAIVAGWIALFALAAWMRDPGMSALGVASASTLVLALLARAAQRRWALLAVVGLWLGIGIATGIAFRLTVIEVAWPTVRATVEDRAAAALRRELDGLRARADTAAAEAAAGPVSFPRLERIRERTGVSALAVYGPNGDPLAWAGEHHGTVPTVVRRGERGYAFGSSPLFGYTYFARPMSGGRTAVGAVLLEANLASGNDPVPFAQRFQARHGILPQFTVPERARGDAIWDWMGDRPIFSVTFATLTQSRWTSRVADRGRWMVLLAWVGALVGVATLSRRSRVARVITLAVTAALLLVPWRTLFPDSALFAPSYFALPLPVEVPLGTALLALVGISIWVLGLRPSGWRPGLPRVVSVLAAVLIFPGALLLVRRAASQTLLADEAAGGVWVQLFTVLLISVPLWILLRAIPTRSRAGHRGVGIAAGVLSVALASGVLVWNPLQSEPVVWTAALWAVPFSLLVWFASPGRGARGALFAWLAVAWIGASAALPHLWLLHWQARLQRADTELSRLGTQPDPLLDRFLRDFAERGLFFASEGERGIDLLYRSWIASELAREGYEARVSLWSGSEREAELSLSDLELPPALVPRMLAAARNSEEPLVQRFTDQSAVHYLLAMSLPGGKVISVAVPPRRRLDRSTALARFLDPTGPGTGAESSSLSLVPAPPGAASVQAHWIRTEEGWRSEARVPFPEGPMHAHLLLRTPPPAMLVTRTVLLGTLHLAAIALLWIVARMIGGLPFGGPAERGWFLTFRGRLTIALFGFFLLPTLLFSAAAYQALSREVVRTAEVLARRSLEQAVDEGPGVSLPVLGQHVRADLLLYRRGVLADAASPEALDLGLYPAWLARDVHLAFRSGETLYLQEQRELAGHPHLVAYHRRGPDAVLAAPTPLVAGETTRRQRELADVVFLAALLGAALSFGLSLLVGRALSAPIERLSRASAAVGRGNLGVRLPEERQDEFGGLYRSFNRMVRRLRRARGAEARTARVLAWGEMARQVAHEIKNPLTPIKLSVQHLRRAYRDGRPDFGDILDRNVEGILREIDHLGEIARAFARFGAPAESAGPLEPVELGPVLADTLALYRGGDDGITYQTEIAPGTPPVQARTGELREVLINLLENARAALDGTGEIRLHASSAEPGWVDLDVVDTGSGIPPDALPRIFEPQFSTRTSGTGLGLAIVRRLAEGWGAEVRAESEPGVGTTIRLRLRVAPVPEQG